MLTRVLLHVIAPTLSVNQSMNPAALLNRRGSLQKVQDLPVFLLRYFDDAQLGTFCLPGRNDPARVKHLPAAGGIKRRAIENDRRT